MVLFFGANMGQMRNLTEIAAGNFEGANRRFGPRVHESPLFHFTVQMDGLFFGANRGQMRNPGQLC